MGFRHRAARCRPRTRYAPSTLEAEATAVTDISSTVLSSSIGERDSKYAHHPENYTVIPQLPARCHRAVGRGCRPSTMDKQGHPGAKDGRKLPAARRVLTVSDPTATGASIGVISPHRRWCERRPWQATCLPPRQPESSVRYAPETAGWHIGRECRRPHRGNVRRPAE